jgi:Carbohydrate family 9 binding domain-like
MDGKRIMLAILCLFIGVRGNATEPEDWPQGYYEAKLTSSVPEINGIGDDNCWTSAVWAPIDQVWIGPAFTADDYTGRFKALWTPDRLYLLIEVIDDSLRLQPANIANVCENVYNFDCVEIFIDEDRSRDVNYSNSYKAFAYHMDTTGNVCYANGSRGWERLDGNIRYKMKRVAEHTFHYEYEIKVFDDSYVLGGDNTPLVLTAGKLMGWSIAYNDNDKGDIRQNMIGSKFIAGNSDYERNVSYYNASVFGDLKLVTDYSTSVPDAGLSDPFLCTINHTGNGIAVYFVNVGREELQVQLFDMTGREMRKYSISKSQETVELTINGSDLPKGSYIIRISGSRYPFEQRIFL